MFVFFLKRREYNNLHRGGKEKNLSRIIKDFSACLEFSFAKALRVSPMITVSSRPFWYSVGMGECLFPSLSVSHTQYSTGT